MKIQMKLAICCTATFTMFSGGLPGQSFTDVYSWDPYYGTVEYMYNRNITFGCVADPLQYCPGNRLRRWEAAVFIIRGLYSAMNANGDPEAFTYQQTPYFTDVNYYDYTNPANTPNGHPAFKYVQKMRELGITTGCTSYEFCPEQPLKNYQVAVFTVRARQIRDGQSIHEPVCYDYYREYNQNLPTCTDQYFTDVDSSYPLFAYIQRAREIIGYSIATGYCPAGQFCPDTADLNDDRYLMHRGDASTYTVYGIWDQAAVAPDPWGSGGSGANALPSLTYCLDAVLIRTSEILTVSPFAYYAEAQSWVEGPDAGLWRSQVRDLKFSYQGQQISPWLYNAPEKSGSARSSARAPTSGYYDPQGGGTFNLETNHRFRGCNATYPYTMTDQVAVPAISSLSPQYLPLGSPTTAISVGGSNLANVEFLPVEPSGGVSATVSSSSASLVQGSVTLQPSAVVGNRSLAVRKPFWYNYEVGGSVYSFRTPQPYTLVSKEYFDSKPATFSIVDATPVIDRIIPTAFQAGSGPVPATIEGRNFGTQPARILINGAQGGSVSTILATVNSTQPNTILATFTPSPDASGDYTVEVLSGGTTGSGFFAPAGQPSPRSNPRNVNVQPQVRMILTVNGAGVSHGGTVTLPWQDPRLHISASLVGATGTASWRINAYYQAPGESSGHSGVYPIEGPVVLSGTSTWSYTVSTGGTVVVQASPSGTPAVSTQFTVRGVNPPGSSWRILDPAPGSGRTCCSPNRASAKTGHSLRAMEPRSSARPTALASYKSSWIPPPTTTWATCSTGVSTWTKPSRRCKLLKRFRRHGGKARSSSGSNGTASILTLPSRARSFTRRRNPVVPIGAGSPIQMM